jgi:ABC-type enterobactin transport system permease subunit
VCSSDLVVVTIGPKKAKALVKVLLDPGSTNTLISRKALPRGTSPIPLQQAKMVTTLAGTMKAAEMVHLRDLRLPEFDKNRQIDEQKALVF